MRGLTLAQIDAWQVLCEEHDALASECGVDRLPDGAVRVTVPGGPVVVLDKQGQAVSHA